VTATIGGNRVSVTWRGNKKKGKWVSSGLHYPTLAVLYQMLNELDPGHRIAANDFLLAMERSGLVVLKEYYVPKLDELYPIYSMVARANSHERVRWVMCRETYYALERAYERTLVPAHWSWPIEAVLDQEGEDIFLEDMLVITRPWGTTDAKLLGLSVRLDPAARAPMLEFYERETSEG
jgi:hypothetical protein